MVQEAEREDSGDYGEEAEENSQQMQQKEYLEDERQNSCINYQESMEDQGIQHIQGE